MPHKLMAHQPDIRRAHGLPGRLQNLIEEASRRFAVPAHWIRAVMTVESAGDAQARSSKGAMGLMQIMPETWADLRIRQGLGTNPYDPRDNILAGAAYLRELHDRYGSPGFLAAYNAGPGRYEEYLATGRPLPAETRAYVAMLAPLFGGGALAGPISVAAVHSWSWTEAPLFIGRPERATAADQRIGSASIGPPLRRPARCAISLHSSRNLTACLLLDPVREACNDAMSQLGAPWRALASVQVAEGERTGSTTSTDGKIKAPPPDGRIWLVGLSFWPLPSSRRLPRLGKSPMISKICGTALVSAPAEPSAMSRRDDDFRIRPGRIRTARGAKPEELRRRGACAPRRRPAISASASARGKAGTGGSTLRTRPARGPRRCRCFDRRGAS